jgi:GPN-loop GTPase
MFGQFVIGPPGSGKTTYCSALSQYFQLIGRPFMIINLDPGNAINENKNHYDCEIDINDLICLENCQEELDLGPNGAMMFCLEYLEKNIDWLKERLKPFERTHYFIFDLPGQVELFNLHNSLKNIINVMQNKWNYRVCTVHLVDGHLCADPSKYVAALLLSLSTMLHLETPHVNVLSKVDLMDKYGDLAFGLDFYTEVQDLTYLAEHLNNDPKFKEYNKMTNAIMEIIEDFSLVRFTAMSVEDFDSVNRVCTLCDKSIGYSPEFHKNTKIENNNNSASNNNSRIHPAIGPRTQWDPRKAYSKMPEEPASSSNIEITERFFKSTKLSTSSNDDDDDDDENKNKLEEELVVVEEDEDEAK